MKSRTTARFRRAYDNLPENIRKQARDAYQLFTENPSHPSLRFKQIHPTRRIYSVRITRSYRALGVRENDVVVWFWIGSHADYDRLLKRG
jgi:mRNA-degrading endonuclease RelE of RelBE toxin-antitoxin system